MSIRVLSLCAELVRRVLREAGMDARPRESAGRKSLLLLWRTGTRSGDADAEIVLPASIS